MIALGFRVKSGYAVAVVLGGDVKKPTALARCVVELSDPDAGETRQPYHARRRPLDAVASNSEPGVAGVPGEPRPLDAVASISEPGVAGVPGEPRPLNAVASILETNEAEIARRVSIIEACAMRSVASLVQAEWRAGVQPIEGIRAALVVGSVIDPARVGNPHIRAHASEGQLFRTVLEQALRSHGIACDTIVEKRLPGRAAADLGRSRAEIARKIGELGRSLGGPWRADEKAAATAAWVVL